MFLNSCPLNWQLLRSHQAEIIIVKRLIQGRNNVTRVRVEQCFYYADFCQRISDLLKQGQIIFGNMIHIALEKSTNLRKYDICILQYWVGTKFRAHKSLFTALGTIAVRKCWHSTINQKVRENTGVELRSCNQGPCKH